MYIADMYMSSYHTCDFVIKTLCAFICKMGISLGLFQNVMYFKRENSYNTENKFWNIKLQSM